MFPYIMVLYFLYCIRLAHTEWSCMQLCDPREKQLVPVCNICRWNTNIWAVRRGVLQHGLHVILTVAGRRSGYQKRLLKSARPKRSTHYPRVSVQRSKVSRQGHLEILVLMVHFIAAKPSVKRLSLSSVQ